MHRTNCIACAVLVGFLIGIQNGYVAVWRDGARQPAYVSQRAVDMLPQADQRALRDGIHVKDRASLTSALEDFLS